ncbi:MAG: hypothetical protein WC683_05765 [bacterium]
MSYPRNAATPKAVCIGRITLIADGSAVTSGASVRVSLDGAAWDAGGGTLSYDATSESASYAPTQAETNGDVLRIAVYKASCIGCSATVFMDPADLASILADTDELQGNQGDWATATGFSTHSAADVKTAIEAAGSSIASILADTGTDGVVVAAASKTGYTLAAAGLDSVDTTEPANYASMNFAERLDFVFRYLTQKKTLTATQKILKKADGTTTALTWPVSDDDTTETENAAT